MEPKIKVKEEFINEIVGFNNSGLPLGERSQEDLRWLATQAQTVNPSLKRFFEKLPTLEQLSGESVEAFLAKTESMELPPLPVDQPIQRPDEDVLPATTEPVATIEEPGAEEPVAPDEDAVSDAPIAPTEEADAAVPVTPISEADADAPVASETKKGKNEGKK
jgi:hypothetical protein